MLEELLDIIKPIEEQMIYINLSMGEIDHLPLSNKQIAEDIFMRKLLFLFSMSLQDVLQTKLSSTFYAVVIL